MNYTLKETLHAHKNIVYSADTAVVLMFRMSGFEVFSSSPDIRSVVIFRPIIRLFPARRISVSSV